MLADRAEQAEPLAEIINSQRLTASDVKYIRETVLRGWVLSDGDANLLIQFQQICSSIDPSWDKFYLLALTNYFIEALEPVGELDNNTCDFIIERLSVDGSLLTRLDVTLLADLLERAMEYPEDLVLLGLNTVKLGLVHRKGVLRPPKTSDTALCEAEVTAVRRFINPKSRELNLGISTEAASLVFDINEISDEDKNHKRWADVFIDCMLKYCLRDASVGINGDQPSAEASGDKPRSWMSSWSAAFESNSKTLSDTITGPEGAQQEADNNNAAARRESSPQNEGEVDLSWLSDRLMAKQNWSPNEERLVQLLQEQSDFLPEQFKALRRA